MRTPRALRTRHGTAAAARSTARCSPPASQAANQRAPAVRARLFTRPRRLESPSSRHSCQRPGRPAARRPAGGAAQRPPSPSSRRHLAAAGRADGRAQPSRPPTHARSTASMGLAPFSPRPGRKRRGGTGRGRGSAWTPARRRSERQRFQLGCRAWKGLVASWLRAAHAEPEVTRLHPDSPAGHRGRSRRPQQKDEETFRREKTNRFSLKQFARE